MSQADVSRYDVNHAPMRLNTYGWVLRSDTTGVSIAGEWSSSDRTYRSTSFIPRPMVVEEVILNLSRKPVKRDRKTVNPPSDIRAVLDPVQPTHDQPPL